MTFRLTEVGQQTDIKCLLIYLYKHKKGWDIELDVPIDPKQYDIN